MSLIIDVPFSEKDEAKSLGAKWTPKLKKWYVEERKNYHKFEKWILGNKENNFNYIDDEIHIVSHIKPLSKDLLDKLKEKYNYYESYSKTINDSYLANHCSNCKIIQGEFFLFGEIDTPFFVDSIEKAKGLKLYKVPLENDLIVDLDIGFGSEDHLIEKYAQKFNF